MEQSYNTLEVEIDFSAKTLLAYFGSDTMKQIRIALDKNNYKKLAPFLIKANDKVLHNCLVYVIHFKSDKIGKKIIENFYKKGRKMDVNKNNSELFRYSVYYNRSRLVIALINIGSNVSVDDNYAFLKYCLLGNLEMVDLLLNKGVDIYCRNCLALVQASGNGKVNLVKLLLEKMGKKIITLSHESNNEHSSTNFDLAMISAVSNNHNSIVQLLLEKGADPSVNNSEVLIVCAEQGNSEMVKLFLQYGADPNILDGIIIKKAIINDHIDIVKILIDFEKNDDYVCDLSINNSAPIRWAAYKGKYEIAKLLLESKNKKGDPRFDVGAENNDAHYLATKYNHTKIIELLEQYIIKMEKNINH